MLRGDTHEAGRDWSSHTEASRHKHGDQEERGEDEDPDMGGVRVMCVSDQEGVQGAGYVAIRHNLSIWAGGLALSEAEDGEDEKEMDEGYEKNWYKNSTDCWGQTKKTPVVARCCVLSEACSRCDARDDQGNAPTDEIILAQRILVSLDVASTDVDLVLWRHYVGIRGVRLGYVPWVDKLLVDNAGYNGEPETSS